MVILLAQFVLRFSILYGEAKQTNWEKSIGELCLSGTYLTYARTKRIRTQTNDK